ncbi:MAG: metallopeptidase TldD-related protein [Kofleriaceae bacterium]
MRLDWSALGTAIAARKLADWVLTSRRRQRLTLHLLAGRERWRADEGETLRVLVRRDLAAGRGTGVVEVHAQTGDAGTVLDHAVALAEASVGPPWTTPPAAAPARVALLDEALVGSLEDALAGLRRALADASAAVGLELADATLRVAREEITLRSALGFQLSWSQSSYELVAELKRDLAVTTVRRRARRLAELEVASAVQAAARAVGRAEARSAVGRSVVLELGVEAMLVDDAHGIWAAIAALGDPGAVARGLARARGAELARPTDAPLTVWSDGTLPYGTLSAPLGDEGEAVRRFPLVVDGRVGEAGAGAEDAARLGVAPNGGVRNLVVNAGAGDSARDRGAQLLEVVRLRWLTLDALRGTAEGELLLAHDRDTRAPLRGGTFVVDLAAVLADARRAPDQVRRGAYLGPSWVRLGPLTLR